MPFHYAVDITCVLSETRLPGRAFVKYVIYMKAVIHAIIKADFPTTPFVHFWVRQNEGFPPTGGGILSCRQSTNQMPWSSIDEIMP